jgi:tetratricopeptide (TPR) repeat protein
LGEPHACLGYVHTVFDWHWENAEREFQKAFELNPSNGSYWYWHANLLGAVGRLEDAISLLREGLQYDPLNIYMNMHMGLTLFTAGDYPQAEQAYKRALELEPSLTAARSSLGLVYHFQGRTDEGLREMKRGVEESGRSQWGLWFLGSTYADLGRREEAEAVLSEMVERRKREVVFNTFIASIHALLGRREEAFRWLDLAFEEREFGLAGWGLHLPSWTFRGLEDDPRFTEILERVREAAQ